MVGGPGAFVIPARTRDKFVEAIRTKMVLEVAGREPQPRVIPASADRATRFLPDRRADVAGALGRLRFPLKASA